MTNREKLKELQINMVREVIDHMRINNLAEVEFHRAFRIDVEEFWADDYQMVPKMVIGLNALGELYLDDGGVVPIGQAYAHEIAYVLDQLEEKKYQVNEYETVPDK